jgi:hypothetical protein
MLEGIGPHPAVARVTAQRPTVTSPSPVPNTPETANDGIGLWTMGCGAARLGMPCDKLTATRFQQLRGKAARPSSQHSVHSYARLLGRIPER